jgi:hypothetical protein
MMRFASFLMVVCVALSGCSSSVRPLHPGDQDVAREMVSKAEGLGLPLSEVGTRNLARALSQGEAYCAMTGEVLVPKVVVNAEDVSAVPVVHFSCVADEQNNTGADTGL